MEVQTKTASSLAANKGVLAKLLATENLTVVHNPNARTASFDTRARVLELPVWGGDMSVDLYDLLTGHEVGHALYTFEAEWIDAIKMLAAKHYPKKQERAMPRIKTVLNIVEDPRIEKLIKRRYPGLKPAFVRGYKELWDKNFFGLNAQMVAGAGFESVQFTDRINLHFKVGAHVRVPFSPAEKVLVDMVEAAETIADAVAASDAIIAFIRETAEEQKQLEKEANDAMKQTAEKGKSEAGKEKQKKKPPQSSDEEDDGEAEPDAGESFDDLENDDEEGEDAEGGDVGDEGDGEESDEDAEDGEGEAEDGADDEEEKEAGNSEGDEEVCDSDEEGEGEGEDGEGEGDEGDEDSDEESDEDGGSSTKEKKLRLKVSEGGRDDSDIDGGDEDGEVTAEDFDADPDELKSITEDALRQNSSSLIDGNSRLLNITAPEIDLKTVVHDFKRVMEDHKKDLAYRLANDTTYPDDNGGNYKPFQRVIDAAAKWAVDFKTSEKQNIGYMLKEFEMKKAARSHARQMTAKTGRLDMNKLHSYKTSEDLFRRSVIQHKGQSHGMMFVLDFSGSMQGTIARLAKSLTSLTMFCRMTNIPFEVYIFTDALMKPGMERYGSNRRVATPGSGFAKTGSDTDMVINRQFWMRNVLSSRMNLGEFNQAVINLRLVAQQQVWCEQMGGTPLLGALMAANELLGEFKSRNKLDNVSLVVMTDGESDSVDRTKKESFSEAFGDTYGAEGKKKNCLVTYTDKVTKRSYTEKLGGTGRTAYGSELTSTICELVVKSIRDRHNANTIGYYIADGDVRYNLQRMLGMSAPGVDYQTTYAMATKLHEEFKDKGFVGLPNGGYDEYYVIQPRLLDSIQKSFAEVTQGALPTTAKKTFANFAKFAKGRDGSRQLLKSFVARITARDRQNG